MRGRAGSAALPALVVLVLVCVVAVAATGSTTRGTNDSRRPSDTLFDTLFTLWIVAVVAGGLLLAYGLLQRQAIAREVASNRYPRFTIANFLVLTGLLAILVWLFKKWSPRGRENLDVDGVFVGPMPVPTASDEEPIRWYEPNVSWLTIAVVGGLVAAAVVAYVVSGRRSRRPRYPHAELALDLAGALDDALDDLRAEPDPRRAIIAAYARLERILAANGVARHASETSDEYLARVLCDLELTPDAIGRLTALFREAKFSHHHVDSTMKESAIGALEQIRDELRALSEAPRTALSHTAQTATS